MNILTVIIWILFYSSIAATSSLDEIIRHEFDNFKSKYGSLLLGQSDSYETERFQTFRSNFERIQVFNYEADQRNLSFRLSVNRFADMQYSEFVQKMTGLIPESDASTLKSVGRSMSLQKKIKRRRSKSRRTTTRPPSNRGLPSSIDWRDKKVVTPVKYQGICGSCWAFSAVAAVESHYAIKTGKLYDLSEQQLVDCSSNNRYGNQGCAGGLMSWAFDYMLNKGGMEEAAYKYIGRKASCRYSNSKSIVQLKTYEYVRGENEMMNIVANVGPITVAIYASPNFQSYSSGIIDDPLCDDGRKPPNHAVVVVGYGRERGKDYWIIKNSWGEDWGENGYAKLLRGVNMCNIQSEVTYPIV